jgi:diguanylate cyclase (GGDEF)-like protein
MSSRKSFVPIYFLALLPLSIAALAWPVASLPLERANYWTIVLGALLVAVTGRVRIQLSRAGSYLTLADALILFSILYFGGEFAVLMAAAGATFNALWPRDQKPFITPIVNICISLTTVFATAVVILMIFEGPESVMSKVGSWTFLPVVGILAVVPFILSTLLGAIHNAINGEDGFLNELRKTARDKSIVYFSASLMAGLGALAFRNTNFFLYVAGAGFFVIMKIAFDSYRDQVDSSKQNVSRPLRRRPRLGGKQVAELQHYIDELERSGEALRESREKYRHAAYHDSLTGLPNRDRFLEIIDSLIKRWQSVPVHKFAVLYLDLNRFKTVNDSLGHTIGDKLIKNVAERLSELVDGDQLIGRFSGDEFAILLPEVADAAHACELAEKILEKLSEPFVLERRQIFTGVSIGIALGSSKYHNAADVLRDADIAMYRAKERKRSIVLFEESMHVQAVSLLQIETDLRLGVERAEFELFYQPIVDLETMRFAGVEALVRWLHPEFGHISPDKFIEIAESTGLIIPMTQQILKSACAMLNQLNGRAEAGAEALFVSVNLSGKHFNHPDVVEHIETILTESKVDPKCIKLEITETAVMDNAERASMVLKQIKALGVQISIDDFGTGYSSLSYLQKFPIDTLKIDRSFVRSMEDGRQNGEIVRMILALADAMKLSVVAEGIESVHQLHQLRILNCRYGQGYLFSHPLPVAEIELLLQTGNRWENLVSGSSFSILPPAPDILDERVH